MSIANPRLNLYFFYSDPFSVEKDLIPAFLQAFNLKPLMPTTWHGELMEGQEITAERHNTHDTAILQVKLTPAENSLNSWDSLTQPVDEIIDWLIDNERVRQPWSYSALYYCEASGETSATDLSKTAARLSQADSSQKPETTPFGWFWLLDEGLQGPTWKRNLLLVIPDDRYPKVQSLLIDSHKGGFNRVELYLQKCKHLTRQHESIWGKLSGAISALQQEMLEHLMTSDFNQIQAKPVLMETMSRQLMRFHSQKAVVELLHNSLNINRKLFEEHLDRLHLDTPLYNRERDMAARQIEQIESDLHNAGVIEESVSAVQDIQRSAEASRFERASYLLGYTAALLAGISLFNSFLDIWSLVLEDSSWAMPEAWIRILLSATASIAIPLAATWFISRKKGPALLATLVSLAAVIGMVLSTILING
jgi:hypothetical protein